MGNTPSSTSDGKQRGGRMSISRPMAMGNQRRALGPDVVVSNTTLSEANHHRHSRQNSRTHSRNGSNEASVPSRLSDEVIRPTLRPEASDIRRARSANVPGPNRADRSEELIGAPPPYTTVYIDAPTQPGFRLPQNLHPHSPPPEDSHIASGSNLRRTATTTPGFTIRGRSPVFDSFTEDVYSEFDRKELVSEDHGYGIGDGSNGPSTSFYSNVDRPLPPVPGSLRFPEPNMNVVTSPTQETTLSNDGLDPLELLKRYNTIFLIDDSGSMKGEKWAESTEALARLADIAASYDLDGIDVHFLNSGRSATSLRSATAVKREFALIQPHGISLLGTKLEEFLREYLSSLESKENSNGNGNARANLKPVNYIIITDGIAVDDPEPVIVQAAQRLDRGNFPVSQVGIQFVQIGNDPGAAEALRELDDMLPRQYGIRDMVDFTPYNGGPLDSEMLIKILLGGISRRVDKRGAGSVMR